MGGMLDVAGIGETIAKSVAEGASAPLFKGTYHFQKFLDKKGKRPNPWAERFPDGIQIQLPQGLVLFLISVGGIMAVFVFWDVFVNYLDKQGWRSKNDTMWKNLMGLGVLGGMSGTLSKDSGDFQNAIKNDVGKAGAWLQGKG